MNINQCTNKLLHVLKQKGEIYKINTFRFYSDKNDKYYTKYQVLKKELVEVYNIEKDKIEFEERYKEKCTCYSKADLIGYFIKEYKGT